jgi:putative addiction module killer protein
VAGGFAFGFGIGAFGLGDEGFAAELDLAALFVNADALDHDLLAFAHFVGGVGHAVVGQFAHMTLDPRQRMRCRGEQAIQAGKDGHEGADLDKMSLLGEYSLMHEVRKTLEFQKWLDGLKDARAYARIETRIFRLGLGLPGDVKSVGKGVSELRIDYGPGYRVYFTKRGKLLIFILVGGDKSTQAKDIQIAIKLASTL